WDTDGSKGISPDQFFAWSAALYPSGYSPFWTSTVEVGPGFKEAKPQAPGEPLRERSRGNGAFYSSSWAPAIARSPQIAFIETWNYWVEGTAIADSVQYGRQYITATAQLAQAYKSSDYSSTTTASVTLDSTNTNSGLYQDELSTAATTAVTIGGKTGRKATGDNMFFSVNDSFLYKGNYGTTVDITIEYYDAASASGGTDWFAIQYDGASAAFYPPSITEQNMVDIKNKGNSKTWKTKTFHFTDAYFGNRQDNRNDFVLKSPGGLIVRQVTVTHPAILDLANKIYVPVITKNSSGW
ncbi:MAG: hypothetical protein Q8P59_07715, partial [Dehalococcoidia bacterium]|nr:hypothetical protein [Dehalococcoidia bacterium]